MRKHKRLWDLYRFPGFHPEHTIMGLFGDPRARIIRLIRPGKKQFVALAGPAILPFTTGRFGEYAICLVGTRGSTWMSRFGGWPVGSAAK